MMSRFELDWRAVSVALDQPVLIVVVFEFPQCLLYLIGRSGRL